MRAPIFLFLQSAFVDFPFIVQGHCSIKTYQQTWRWLLLHVFLSGYNSFYIPYFLYISVCFTFHILHFQSCNMFSLCYHVLFTFCTLESRSDCCYFEDPQDELSSTCSWSNQNGFLLKLNSSVYRPFPSRIYGWFFQMEISHIWGTSWGLKAPPLETAAFCQDVKDTIVRKSEEHCMELLLWRLEL